MVVCLVWVMFSLRYDSYYFKFYSLPWVFLAKLHEERLEKNLEPVFEFCCISLLAPKEEDVEFNSFMPDPPLFELKFIELDRYFIGDPSSKDINNFNNLILNNLTIFK